MILQADYYETSTWLTEEEKKELDRKEQNRLEKYKVERIIEYLDGLKLEIPRNCVSQDDTIT